MERGRPKHLKACAATALVACALRFAAFASPEAVARACAMLSEPPCRGAVVRATLVVVACLVYAWEASRSSTLRYVSDARPAADVDAFLRRALDAPPVVTWTAVSYHYERSRRHGKSSESRRVVTAVNREAWAFGAWRDGSGGLQSLATRWRDACAVGSSPQRKALVKVRLTKALLFDDEATAEDYHASLADFARRHRHRDVHLSVEQDFTLDGWDDDERLLAIRRPLGAPGRLWSPAGFWAAAALGLTVPYRLALERKCAVATLQVLKRAKARIPTVYGAADDEPPTGF